ncbi:MAG: disulfide bond formation protein DsbA [Alphaproteobacteria bacterium]|nr:disulfide bond formation protein DsbA [Alphaproteobacteria bacterium]
MTDRRLYLDLKSPYAYLAKDPARQLEQRFGFAFRWLPYTLRIPEFLGTPEDRNAHQWRRVRYSYMDARRAANERGLVILGPQKIFDTSLAHIGWLYAERTGPAVRARYLDLAFERFWKRELAIEDAGAIAQTLAEAGADAAGFAPYLAGSGRAAYEAVLNEAEAMGVFGVPMFVLDGELIWGQDRLSLVVDRLSGKGPAPPARVR